MGMKTDIKVGDKVRCISTDGHAPFIIGKTYVVERAHEYKCGDILIHCEGVDGGMWPDRFELVKAAWEPKIGDRVRLKKDNGALGEFGAAGDEGIVSTALDEGMESGVDFTTGKHKGDYWYVKVENLEPIQTPLTIEAGRYYRTRDGRKVGPASANPSDVWLNKDAYGNVGKFHISGLGVLTSYGKWLSSPVDNRHDIVSLWPDEPTTPPVSAQVDALAEEYGPVIPASAPPAATTPEPANDNLAITFEIDFSALDEAIAKRKKRIKKLIKLARKAGIDLREAA